LLLDYRRIAIAIGDGASLFAAKTAINLLRYRTDDIVAVIDEAHEGRTAGEVYGAGGRIPVFASLAEVDHPDAVFIGIAPSGGHITGSLRLIVDDAVATGIDVVSGLHDFLIEIPWLREKAEQTGSLLIDIRRNRIKRVSQAEQFRAGCLRIHTVGHDCSVGKMVVALEVSRALERLGHDAKFLATGQTGIMLAGEGVPVDCVISDFVNGAVEELVSRNQQHDILLIEGQGAITHPSFSGVTLGLLHGCAPHGLILCYEVGRSHLNGFPHVVPPSLERLRKLYEEMASERFPCEVIGIAMNSRSLTPEQAATEKVHVSSHLRLPVCDVYRDGPECLVEAVLKFKSLTSKLLRIE
jgi:uncharacterized NAD-dependent epimerase/dehydratase family protein